MTSVCCKHVHILAAFFPRQYHPPPHTWLTPDEVVHYPWSSIIQYFAILVVILKEKPRGQSLFNRVWFDMLIKYHVKFGLRISCSPVRSTYSLFKTNVRIRLTSVQKAKFTGKTSLLPVITPILATVFKPRSLFFVSKKVGRPYYLNGWQNNYIDYSHLS